MLSKSVQMLMMLFFFFNISIKILFTVWITCRHNIFQSNKESAESFYQNQQGQAVLIFSPSNIHWSPRSLSLISSSHSLLCQTICSGHLKNPDQPSLSAFSRHYYMQQKKNKKNMQSSNLRWFQLMLNVAAKCSATFSDHNHLNTCPWSTTTLLPVWHRAKAKSEKCTRGLRHALVGR